MIQAFLCIFIQFPTVFHISDWPMGLEAVNHWIYITSS